MASDDDDDMSSTVNNDMEMNAEGNCYVGLNAYISDALQQMSIGNYDGALKLLQTAKQLYPNSSIEQLQTIIRKMKYKASTSEASNLYYNDGAGDYDVQMPSTSRAAAASASATATATANIGTANYTREQLNAVNRCRFCRSYYDILNVSPDATYADIRKSYKSLALQLHPDKNHASGAAEAFKLLVNAWTILSDVTRRQEYDAAGGTGFVGADSQMATHFTNDSNYQYYEETFPNADDNNDNDNVNDNDNISEDGDDNDIDNEYNYNYTFNDNDFNDDDLDESITQDLYDEFFGSNNYRQRRHQRDNMWEQPIQQPMHNRFYEDGNQRQPQQPNAADQPTSLAFGVILILIVISLLTSFFTSEPIYSLSPSNDYPLQRTTQRFGIKYFVKETFLNDYENRLGRIETAVEEDFVYIKKQDCLRERNYRDALMARAQTLGSRLQYIQAQNMKTPSCDELVKFGIIRYLLY